MIRIAKQVLLVTALVLSAAAAWAVEPSQCVTCHQELDSALATPVKLFENDVHHKAGLSCADCHGGDPSQEDAELSMSKAKGFLGKPTPLEMPHFCDRCHGSADYMKQFNPGLPVDQLVKYRSSVHGQKNAKGDVKAAQCASCHVPHNMRPSSDPTSSIYPLNIPGMCARCHSDAAYMAPYGIPTDQYAKFSTSVHGKALLGKHDLGAPACNDCHGNHAASPPLEAAIPNVCGNCHAFNAELFSKSPHKAGFEEQELPACETCHGNHAIIQLTSANLGSTPESVCTNCHTEGDGTKGFQTAVNMQRGLVGMEEGYRHADSLLAEAELKGMYVDEARFSLNDARQSIIQAHTLVHSFNDSVMQIKVDSGMMILTAVQTKAEEKLAESAFRRWGLLISTLIISFVAVLLYLKIRQIEGR